MRGPRLRARGDGSSTQISIEPKGEDEFSRGDILHEGSNGNYLLTLL